MSRTKIDIPRERLFNLYHTENKTPEEIGLIFDCSFATVRNRIKEHGIKLKNPSVARMKYKKFDFNGTPEDLAYILGFRVGDLNVYKPNKKTSKTIVVRCHTTHSAQTKLFENIFSQYGHINKSISKESERVHINCYLNETFSFLMQKYDKKSRQFIKKGPTSTKLAFIAGYSDAEGSFGINQMKARFKIDSYDYKVLCDIISYLDLINVSYKFTKIAKKGQPRYQNEGTWNNDLWRLTINRAQCIKSFILQVGPYLRHENRLRDAKISLKNINNRIKNGTVK